MLIDRISFYHLIKENKKICQKKDKKTKEVLCISNLESSSMLLMSLEMLDFSNILNCQEFVCLVDNQLVNHRCWKVSLVLIVFQEEMVFVQEDHWS